MATTSVGKQFPEKRFGFFKSISNFRMARNKEQMNAQSHLLYGGESRLLGRPELSYRQGCQGNSFCSSSRNLNGHK
jgi:hypothetical protein